MESFDIRQIPRDDNSLADRLAKLASSLASLGSRRITFLTLPSTQLEEGSNEVLCNTSDSEPLWKDAIIKYLNTRDLNADTNEASKLKTRALRFVFIDDELYKEGYSLPYLKCLSPFKADYMLREIHEGICGNRLGGRALAGKALRQGYY